MESLHFSKADKELIRHHTRNLPIFHRRYQMGDKKGQFIFETRLMKGSKAKLNGFIKDEHGLPLIDNVKYHIPVAHVMEYPYSYFIRTLKNKNVAIVPELLDEITREYLKEYEEAEKQFVEINTPPKQETNTTKEEIS